MFNVTKRFKSIWLTSTYIPGFGVRILSFFVILLVASFSYILLFGYVNTVNETNKFKRQAVIYARPTFHEEVVSAVACTLKSLDYHVIVYIGNGFYWGSFLIPFTSRRQVDSNRFYGQCVSEWITIKPGMKLKTDADIFVVVTYPMYYARQIDTFAMEYVSKIIEMKSKMKVALIGHRASDFFNHNVMSMFHLERMGIPRNQMVLLTLSEHTHLNAKTELMKYKAKIGDVSTIHLEYFYPVLPPNHIKIPSSPTITFSIQGKAIVNIVYITLTMNFIVIPTLHILLSGKMKPKLVGGSPLTKDPFAIADCLRNHEKSYSQLCESSNHDNKRLGSTTCSLSFEIVGSTDEALNLGTLSSGKIYVKSGLNAVQYYEAIANSKFMVLGIINKEYLVNRATSSVPAALISRGKQVS